MMENTYTSFNYYILQRVLFSASREDTRKIPNCSQYFVTVNNFIQV